MHIETQIKIKNDLNSQKFLRENSYWYKYLNRNKNYYKDFIEDMKEKYKLTPEDRMKNMVEGINKLSEILDILS